MRRYTEVRQSPCKRGYGLVLIQEPTSEEVMGFEMPGFSMKIADPLCDCYREHKTQEQAASCPAALQELAAAQAEWEEEEKRK